MRLGYRTKCIVFLSKVTYTIDLSHNGKIKTFAEKTEFYAKTHDNNEH